MDVELPPPNDKSNTMGALTFLFLFNVLFFLKLIVACRLCCIYAREDNDSNVQAMITLLV